MAAIPSPPKTSLPASKVSELKALCSKHGLPVSGNKGELINRLTAYYEANKISSTPSVTPSKDSKPTSAVIPPTDSIASKPTPATQPEPPKTNNNPVQSVPAPAALSTPNSKADKAEKADQPIRKPLSSGANENTVDDEVEKLKRRAERFGLTNPTVSNPTTPAEQDVLKKALRAQKFGITPEKAALEALDRPLADGKNAKAIIKSAADLEWEAKKRKRAEKFGLIDNPPSSNTKNNDFPRKHHKFNNNRV